jgi:hypothetical protein
VVTEPTIQLGQPARKSRRGFILSIVLGLVVMVLLFWFIGQNAGEYRKAFTELGAIDPLWKTLIGVASLINIAIYPLTAIAAIRTLSYLHASLSRQAGLGWFLPQLLVGALALAKFGWDRKRGRHVTA